MLRYGISLTLDAPLKYAYEWCTDFRNEDPFIPGGAYPRHILRRRKDGFVWIQHYKRDGIEKEGVRIVTLRPPNAWHYESIGEEKESIIDYRLSPLGKKRTKLNISVGATYKTIEPEDRPLLEKNMSAEWEKYKAALEADYSSGKASTA